MSEEKYAELLANFTKKETPQRKVRLTRMDNTYYIGDLEEGKAKNARIRKPSADKRYVSKNKMK